jgi:uncharacterized membrane protein
VRTVPYLALVSILGLAIFDPTISWGATKVGVLYMGDPYPGVTPYVYMNSEPLLRVTPVAASQDYLNFIFSLDEIRRSVRLYMPRTYGSLLSSYDVMILSDSNVASFSSSHLLWFRRGVYEGGLGLVMVGGHETFGTMGTHSDWGQTPVGEVLPVETLSGKIGGGKVSIHEGDNVFINSIPWRPDLSFLQLYYCNIVVPKEGSETLATAAIRAGDYQGWRNPFFSTWEIGEGRTFAFAGDWQYGWGSEFVRWEYTPDFAINLMLYLAGRRIPEDLELVHTLRSRMATFSYRRAILESLINFVEKFGANPRDLVQAAEKVDGARRTFTDLYLEEEFDAALGAVDDALVLMDEAEDVADRVKRNALLWIYLTEWMATTATAMICGMVVWTLMVRRRLYREVGVTQFR